MGRFRRLIPIWSLRREIVALFYAWRNPATPRGVKLLGLIAVLYAISPFDLVSDLIPILGWIDDLVIVPALLAAMRRLVPRDVMEESRRKAKYVRNEKL